MSEANITRRSRGDRRTGKTDWKRLERQTDEDIKRAVASDSDAAPLLDEEWFAKAEVVPPNKERITIRVDADVLDFFKASGPRYQSRMNAVLRAYMEARQRQSG